jgi:putative PIN family toxin of toxin-antitoxin system
MLKIVLDTNVLLDSAKGSFSYPSRIMQEVIDGNIEAFTSHRIMREHNLIRKRIVNDPEVHAQIEEYLEHVQEVRPSVRISVVETDHEDDKFIEAAYEAQCDYIITSDRDLLGLKSYGEIKMVTPGDFWKTYQEIKDPEGSGQWNDWISGFFQGN